MSTNYTYPQALLYLTGIAAKKNLKHPLETLKDFMNIFGAPQEKLKIIHVAGTNGKGSACAMLTSILTESGYRVGTFTSPHLSVYNERITINGKNIEDGDFARLIFEVKQACIKYFKDNDCELSFFELLTVMAFIYFYEQKVDYAVIETGMGGRLDATNIIAKPILSIITSVGYDHTDILGPSIESISGEKAGIIKKNCPTVLYYNSNEVYNVIKDTAEKLSSEFYYDDSAVCEVINADLSGTLFSVNSRYFSYGGIKINLFGKYQIENTLGVLLSVYALNRLGICIGSAEVIRALKGVTWKCRMEIMRENPVILIDGAHNGQGAAAFAEAMSYFSGRKIILIVGILKNKPYKEIMEHLLRVSNTVIATEPDNPRALEAQVLAGYAASVLPRVSEEYAASVQPRVLAIKNCREALDKAMMLAGTNDVIAIAGSLYLAGSLREYLSV
ncbi:MAG: bifunctional folylpolyglutamate synthase/dihydrofolate synthase [Clostridiales bacterium]|nr:bifunctional folylpolyglutamate synthase/dihydrofolate synthase [Clostridiales bacterium]